MSKSKCLLILGAFVLFCSFTSCKTIPKNATAVKNFQKDKYLGTWYEIARLDFKFERDLIRTKAEYSLRSDGKIKVVNSGYNTVQRKDKVAEAKAKFVGDENVGMLQVSFFGPFYSGYNVISIDGDYQYALVIGKNYKYMWFLSREKTLPEEIKSKYLKIVGALGYPTDELVWVEQD